MYCGNCGSNNADGMPSCVNCGAPLIPPQPDTNYQQPPVYQQPMYQQPMYQQPMYQQPVYPQPKKNSDLPLISMIIGILSVFCCSFYGITGLTAVILSIISLKKINDDGTEGKEMAIAGLILGIIGIIIGIVSIVIFSNNVSYYITTNK